jgi:predicted RNase H-like HicB family nuclease
MKKMLTDYIHAAMRHARYEIINDPKSFYGCIPECPSVWATGETLEVCREELQSVLEDWIVLGLRLGHPIPVIDSIAVAPAKLEPIDV